MGTLRADSMMEPKNALQKPSTENPGAICPAKRSKSAFIMSVNNPSVRKFIGSVIKSKIGFKNVLIKPKSIATNKAVMKLLTPIPGISHAINTIDSE